ncbi:carbohydrate kinase family protein [candidate division WWE3 bacterium]|nr:carbohydrate kinase family protein [candidate division WWE3 bacterium]
MFDLISVGDSVIDAFMFINEAEVICDINKEECKFCVSYADKVPVEKFALCTAGNACNNAVGSARLGLNTAIYTEIGNDNNGKMIVDKFRDVGVSLEYVNLNKNGATNLHAVISYQGERTIFVYHEPRNYKLPPIQKPPVWIYYTSLSKGFENFQDELLTYLKSNPDVKLVFNPATYHLRAGLPVLRGVLALCEIVFINKEEAKKLLGIDLEEEVPIKSLHQKVAELGPKISVITDGPKGSSVYDRTEYFQLGLYDAPIVDRTGVGDAFATAFVAATFYGKGIEVAMKWGTINAAGVIQKIGPQDGLMTRGEIEFALNSNPKFTEVDLL